MILEDSEYFIGPAIEYHLQKNGCSKYKLAAAWVVDRSAITALCKPKSNPTWLTIMRVAKTLGITVAEIVKTAEDMRKDSEQ